MHGKKIPGCDKDEKTTQDAYAIHTTPNNKYKCIVVADGHGSYFGKYAADYSTTEVIKWTDTNSNTISLWNNEEELKKSVIQLFADIHNNFRTYIMKNYKGVKNLNQVLIGENTGEYLDGGTTLTCIWIFEKEGIYHYHTANVGDSEAELVTIERNKKADYKRIKLTVAHSLDNTEETNRFESLINHLSKDDKPTLEKVSQGYLSLSEKVSNQYQFKSIKLQMTRSIGDFPFHLYGVTTEPSQKSGTLDTVNNEYIIIAGSDGYWHWEEDTRIKVATNLISDILIKRKTFNECVETSITFASKTGIEKHPNCDDITLVCVKI